MTLTPEAVRQVSFGIVRRGYDPREVDAFVDQVTSYVETAPEPQIEEPGTAVQRELERVGKQTAEVLQTAERTALEIRQEADRQAKTLVSDARREAEKLRTEARRRVADTEQLIANLEERRTELVEELRDLGAQITELVEVQMGKIGIPADDQVTRVADAHDVAFEHDSGVEGSQVEMFEGVGAVKPIRRDS